jgi:Ca2+-binding RTX toxin-like protein
MAVLGSGVTIADALDDHLDVNTYAVVLSAGHVYDLWLAGDDTNDELIAVVPALDDPRLTISGPGTALDDDDTAEGLNALIRFTPGTTGAYTITARESANSAGTAPRSYVLNISDMSLETDITGHIFDAAATTAGGDTVGADMILALHDVLVSDIERDGTQDADVVAVFLADGITYDISMRGLPPPSIDGTLPDPELTLLNAAGVEVAFNDNQGGGSLHALIDNFDPAASGWFYIIAKSHDSGTGTYELEVTPSPPAAGDQVLGSVLSLSNVPVGGAIQGEIESNGDEDWYAFRVANGQSYRFDLAAIGLADPELFLRDSAGALLASDNDSGDGDNARINFIATFDGLVFLDAHDNAAGTGTFQLSATLFTASTAANIVADASVAPPSDSEIVGSDLADSLTGGAGNDSIDGRIGNDTIDGGAGDDTIEAGASISNDVVDGNSGNDVVNGNAGSSTINGGQGADLLNGLDGFDVLNGDDGDDTLSGGGENDIIDGGSGNDRISGETAHDFINGGAGNDTIDGGDGSNMLDGNEGDDVFENVDFGDSVTGGAGIDTVNALTPYVLPAAVENLNLLGGAFFSGTGNSLSNVIVGNVGKNVLSGLGGSDTINGGLGDDTIIGGAGKDLNTGSGGLDVMDYNALSESGPTFAARDAINTFAHGDKIDLSTIDANANVAGNQAFVFVANFTGNAGQLQFDQVATNSWFVSADVNGDGSAEFSLNIYSAPGFGQLQSWDFIL